MTPSPPPAAGPATREQGSGERDNLIKRIRRLREVLGEIAADDDEGDTVKNQRAQDQRWAIAAIEEDGEEP